MGAKLANGIQDCTHLVALKIVRTEKMLMAINSVHHIVHDDWLRKSAENGEFLGKMRKTYCLCSDLIHILHFLSLDEREFLLNDVDSEKFFNCKFEETRRRARETPRLFKDYLFYASENVLPSLEILRRIIENAGGSLLRKEDLDKTIKELRESTSGRIHNNTLKFVVIGCDNDRDSIVSTFFETPRVPHVDHVYTTDLILNGIIQWKLDFKTHHLELNL
jgi:hypothetical protein